MELTPQHLKRIIGAGLHGCTSPDVQSALIKMLEQIDLETRPTPDIHGRTIGYLPVATAPETPPPTPLAEYQGTPDGRYHRVVVYFGADEPQARHMAEWVNRGAWAEYHAWYQGLRAPESNGAQSNPADVGYEPRWPLVPPPGASATHTVPLSQVEPANLSVAFGGGYAVGGGGAAYPDPPGTRYPVGNGQPPTYDPFMFAPKHATPPEGNRES